MVVDHNILPPANKKDSKTCVKLPLSKRPEIVFTDPSVFQTNYRLMKVKSIAECSKRSKEHSAILSTFIKLPFVIKILFLSIFEWPYYTGFTVGHKKKNISSHVIILRIFLGLFWG